MKKKIALFMAVSVMALSLTACGESEASDISAGGDKAEATTAAPETEITTAESVVTTEAPVPETEATEATTTEAVTEAPATEATTATTTVTTAATTKAPARQADFEKYGFKCFDIDSVDPHFRGARGEDVVIMGSSDWSNVIKGKLRFAESFRFISYDNVYPAKEGYEWVHMYAPVDFYPNQVTDSWQIGIWSTNYYDIDGFENSLTEITNVGGEKGHKFTVNYNGVEYKDCEMWSYFGYAYGSTLDDSAEMYIDFYFRVPKGYDGCVVALYDMREGKKSDNIYEWDNKDTVFLRLV